jgi:diguanylate cyclase (GGDEF)-like protein
VIYSEDLILQRLIVVAWGPDGCPSVKASGRDLPFQERSIPSLFPNLVLSGPTATGHEAIVLLQTSNTDRAWLKLASRASFQQLSARLWLIAGGYGMLLLVLTLICLSYVIGFRSRLAVAYLIYILTLQFYQLQALGIGPAWLPFWPQQVPFQVMQGMAVAGMALGLGTAVVSFLTPRGILLHLLVLGTGTSLLLFLASGWYPPSYRFGALSVAFLAVVTLMILLRSLRDGKPYRRWFALGLGASIVGGAAQAASVFMDSPPTLPLVFAFPLGTLIESVLWLVAVVSQASQERRTFQVRLLQEALHDPLTGLPNRRQMRDGIQTRLAAAHNRFGGDATTFGPRSQGTLLHLDLDHFKAINNSLGHDLGDQLLVKISRLLVSALPDQTLVARLGSDEFGVLLTPGMSPEATAQRLYQQLATPVLLHDRPIRVHCSMGSVPLTADDRDADQVLRNAGIALGTAKAAGGNRMACFSQTMHATAKRWFDLEQALELALERGEELSMAYQPVVALASGAAVGFEALLRWQHPRLGPISPAEFVPLAERCGLIQPLGEWVLTDVVAQIARWQQDDLWRPGFYVGVNLSGGQLLNDALVPWIDGLLERYEVRPGSLRIELTETAVISNLDVAQQVLPALRERGMLLCMDDFGTGYSSLSSLRQLPFDVLKIDRSFVTGCDRDEASAVIVRTILAMADQLKMTVIAEGMETAAEANLLSGLGCPYGQGWYFAHARSAEESRFWLQAGACKGPLRLIEGDAEAASSADLHRRQQRAVIESLI